MVQSTQYYPFGTPFADATGANVPPYKYNNKELDGRNGLNWYDYSTRYLSLDIPVMLTVDTLAKKYYSISPYVYCGNSPIKRIDPTGMAYGDYYAMNGTYLGSDGIDDDKLYAVQNDGYRTKADGTNLMAKSKITDLTEETGIKHSEFQQMAARIYNEAGNLSEKGLKQLASAIHNRKGQSGLGSETWQKTIDRTAFWSDTHEQRMSEQRRKPKEGDKIPGTKIDLKYVTEKNYQDYINTPPSERNTSSGMKNSTAATVYTLTGGKDLVNGAYMWWGNGRENLFYKKKIGDTKY